MDLLRKILKGILGVALWSYIFALFFIEGTYVPFIGNKDASSASETTSPDKPNSGLLAAHAQTPPPPDVVTEIYAMELFREFNADEAAAKRKYGGKTVVVSGLHFRLLENPFSIGTESPFNLYIEEQTAWMETTSVVKCGVSEAVAQSFAAVDSPHMFKLKGKVQGSYYGDEVEIYNCTLVSLG